MAMPCSSNYSASHACLFLKNSEQIVQLKMISPEEGREQTRARCFWKADSHCKAENSTGTEMGHNYQRYLRLIFILLSYQAHCCKNKRDEIQ